MCTGEIHSPISVIKYSKTLRVPFLIVIKTGNRYCIWDLFHYSFTKIHSYWHTFIYLRNAFPFSISESPLDCVFNFILQFIQPYLIMK
jgi:hypothetical protein